MGAPWAFYIKQELLLFHQWAYPWARLWLDYNSAHGRIFLKTKCFYFIIHGRIHGQCVSTLKVSLFFASKCFWRLIHGHIG